MENKTINIFIKECLTDGLSSTTKMIERAQEKLSVCENNITQDLNSLEVHRKEKAYLLNVLTHFGVPLTKKRNIIHPKNLDIEFSLENMPPVVKSICDQILIIFNNSNESISASLIHKKILDSDLEVSTPNHEKQKITIYLFKLLQEEGILKVNELVPLSFIKGVNWEKLNKYLT